MTIRKPTLTDAKQADDYNCIATTWHEASHTIISLINYLYVFSVNTIDEKTDDGNTEFFVYTNDKLDILIQQKIMIWEIQAIYAGHIGEKIYYKDICGSTRFPNHLKAGSSSDFLAASKIIRDGKLSKPGKETADLKKKIQIDTENLLNAHWSAVKLVVHSLYKKKRLSFDDLKFLLTRKIEQDKRQFWKDKFKELIFLHSDKASVNPDLVGELLALK